SPLRGRAGRRTHSPVRPCRPLRFALDDGRLHARCDPAFPATQAIEKPPVPAAVPVGDHPARLDGAVRAGDLTFENDLSGLVHTTLMPFTESRDVGTPGLVQG